MSGRQRQQAELLTSLTERINMKMENYQGRHSELEVLESALYELTLLLEVTNSWRCCKLATGQNTVIFHV